MNYQQQCNKYFAPLDEIAEALLNKEYTSFGFSSWKDFVLFCHNNDDLSADLDGYQDIDTFDLVEDLK